MIYFKLTVEEILFILEKINKGGGWSGNKEIGQLQAKLSIELEVAHKFDRHSPEIKEEGND